MTAGQRLNNYLGHKRQLLGNQAGRVAPAWKASNGAPTPNSAGKGRTQEQGSKIFLSRLPLDVDDKEVEELFRKTVGPLKECFLIYNSQGRSKGMAVVAFTRPGDAALARSKYDGKIVDGRRPLKIEIIVDENQANQPPQPVSLLARLGAPVSNPPPIAFGAPALKTTTAPQIKPPQQPRSPTQPAPAPVVAAPLAPKRRYKKGPKRVQKRVVVFARVTKDQLDKEMEDYRAAADV